MKIFLAIVKIWSENMDERHPRNEKIAHFWEAIFQKLLGVGPKNLARLTFSLYPTSVQKMKKIRVNGNHFLIFGVDSK